MMSNLNHSDPAENGFFMRLLYRNWRPTRLGRWIGRLMIWWTGLNRSRGIVAILEVKGSTPNQNSTVPMVIATVDDKQYIVSMLGPGSNWVRNVDAANGYAVLRRERPRPVRLVPVEPEKRAPVLKEYVRVATSGRKHFPLAVDAPLSEFHKIAERYPVFRVDSANAGAAANEGDS